MSAIAELHWYLQEHLKRDFVGLQLSGTAYAFIEHGMPKTEGEK